VFGTPQADQQAREHDVLLVKERCIEEEHRHLIKDGGRSARLGVHVSRRHKTYEDTRKDLEEDGYTEAEAESTKVAEASAPCWMKRRWSAAVPHRDKARSSGHARKQIEKIRQSQNALSV
jgi:hypothetical protein